MGAAVAGPLSIVSAGLRDVITEAMTARPAGVQTALRPLLDLDLHGLCEAYRLLAQQASSTLALADLEQVLGLPSLASKIIMARRSSIGSLELLTLLALLSHTHAAVKVRFLHSAANWSFTGRLNFNEFRAVAVAFLRTACFIAHIPRGQWPKVATVDVLVTPLFERYSPDISKDHFVLLFMSNGPLARMLHHFARGAVDQNFRLARIDTAAPKISESREDAVISVASVLPERRSPAKLHSGRASPADSLYKVLPRKTRTVAVLSSTPSDLDEYEVACSSIHSPRTPRTPRTPTYRPKSANEHRALPRGVARRRGYFQAIPSQRESALQRELERLQNVTIDSKSGTPVDLLRREAQLRTEIGADILDEERRTTYRKCVDDIRNGMLSSPDGVGILPAGCLWSASQMHIDRGGSLPPGCIRPVTPSVIQQRIQDHDVGVQKSNTKAKSHSQSPSVDATGHVQNLLSKFNLPVDGSKVPKSRIKDSDDERSDSSGTDVAVSLGNRRARLDNARPADVLVAFELYRNSYWRRDGCETSHRYQRDADIEAILIEAAREPHSWRDCTTALRTLRHFFQSIWPNLKPADFKTMLQTIERSKTPEAVSGPAGVESPQRQAETLRELVELFDAIDVESSGAVPLDAVEQFLCGELLTAREIEQLALQRQQFGSPLVGKPAGCEAYIDSIRDHNRGRFMMMEVEDRDEWSVTVADNERRWVGLRLQAAMSAKAAHQAPPETQPSLNGSALKAKSTALYRIIGQRMEKLARFIEGEDEDAVARAVSDISEDLVAGAGHLEIPNGDLEVACKPGLIPPDTKQASRKASSDMNAMPSRKSTSVSDQFSFDMQPTLSGEVDHAAQLPTQLRLVRLYWRYLLGSAVQQQLRDSEQTSYLNFRADGQIDLVGFICILAHDQLRGLFPKGTTPTAKVIRETAYAK